MASIPMKKHISISLTILLFCTRSVMAQSLWQAEVDVLQAVTNNFGNTVPANMTNAANSFTGSHSGNGSGLTNYQGTNLANGGSSAGQILTATTSGAAWSNASGGVTLGGVTNVAAALTNGLATTNYVNTAATNANWTILTSSIVNNTLYTNTSGVRAIIEGRYYSTLSAAGVGGYYFISISNGRDGSLVTNTIQVKAASGNIFMIPVNRHINAGEVFEFTDNTPGGTGYLTNCDVIY
jgi:hypothetical protein